MDINKDKYEKHKRPVKLHVRMRYQKIETGLFDQLFTSAYNDGYLRFEKYFDKTRHGTELAYLKTTALNAFNVEFSKYMKYQHRNDTENDLWVPIESEPDIEISFDEFITKEFRNLFISVTQKTSDVNARKLFTENLPILKRKYWTMDSKVSEQGLQQLMLGAKIDSSDSEFYLTEYIYEISKIKAWIKGSSRG